MLSLENLLSLCASSQPSPVQSQAIPLTCCIYYICGKWPFRTFSPHVCTYSVSAGEE
ncbi:hypothetical protein PF008_g11030 [Phytophthora fragariae]|uniref:Uncharacterized protein n=1 Tax=Phytophthora fragariae TaxID=53985 RepID=A0A6G0RS51_9STRA|nr:hypothetical protein PF008_g11030 [Phytophthora fragariae]